MFYFKSDHNFFFLTFEIFRMTIKKAQYVEDTHTQKSKFYKYSKLIYQSMSNISKQFVYSPIYTTCNGKKKKIKQFCDEQQS